MNENRWVDPRQHPKPPTPLARCEPANNPQEIADLLAFCRSGRIHQIERWILAGKPLQATAYDVRRRKRLESPIEIAIAKGLYDVALLLLCNGYLLDLDPDQFSTPLDQALQNRAWDLVELLLEWGADPRTVDPENVFHTYRGDLIVILNPKRKKSII